MRLFSIGSALLLSLALLGAGAQAENPPRRPPGRPERPPRQPPAPPPERPEKPPGPPQNLIDRARAAGVQDGRSAGSTEGRTAGLNEGRTAGDRDGYRNGFDRCERESKQREHDRGFQIGYNEGDRLGDREGREQGDREGQRRGSVEGEQDGIGRANSDALNAATGPGRERGYQEANQSNASTVGRTEGIAAADQNARAQAERVDYPRGREALRSERWAEAIGREDDFRQKEIMQTQSNTRMSLFSASTNFLSVMNSANSNEMRPQSRRFGTPEEQRAYDQAYRQSYQQAYNSEKENSYRHAYNEAQRLALDKGCQEARRRNYQADYNLGYEQGKRQGYRQAYDRAYAASYRNSYDRFFRSNSQSAYNRHYQEFYNRHFEAARASAYRDRYEQLYQQAYRPAYDEKYAQVYPGYSEQAYQRGRADEAKEFTDRPLRLVAVNATETIINGLYEPGEALRTKFVVRNFAGNRFDGQQVKITLTSLDAGAATISEPSSGLVKGLEGKSQTTIREALEFYMNEVALNQSKRLRLEIYVNGRLSDSQEFSVQTKFIADLRIPNLPDLKEGLQTTLEVLVKNQSEQPTDENFEVQLVSRPELLEVLDGVQTVGVLGIGQERRLTFKVVARSHDERIKLPIALEARTHQRRIGALNLEPTLPVTNEYRVDILSGIENLSQPGVVRIEYKLTNVSSRLQMNSLQLSAAVLGEQSAEFAVVGPNPQLIEPMLPGQSITFVIPVIVKQMGQHGVLQIEIKENGRTTMIHRREF